MAKSTEFKLFQRLLHQIRPYWLHIAGNLLLSLLATPLSLLYPLPLKIGVDSIIGSQPLPGFLDVLIPETVKQSKTTLLVFTVGLVVVIALLAGLQGLGASSLRTYIGEKLVLDFRSQLFRHMQRLSLSYHDSKGTSDSLYLIQSDAEAIQYLVTDGAIPFITASFTLAAMIYVIWCIDWQLTAIALAVSPLLTLLARNYQGPLRRRWQALYALNSSALSVVQEVLTGLRVVKAFGQENRELQRFVDRSQETKKARIRISFLEGGLSLVMHLTSEIGRATVLFIGLRQVLAGRLTLGDLLLVMGYLSDLYGPLTTISSQLTSLQSHLAHLERAFLLLEEAPDVPERPNARSLLMSDGAVAFHNVCFDYGNNRPVVRNISFTISPGTRVGIAGRTGAGKTTLLSLLTRFYDPTEGQILLDDIDLRDYKLADLRNQFAIVLQEPVLFSTGIAENIAYANLGASEEEIIEAAKAANAHEFIVNLPEGYNTQVGERGMRLSGGERQRIALARAFLKDAPILILDEPTSSVDIKTEAAIVEAMERLMKGRTTFMIAHRLSTLESCDLMLVMEAGRLVAVETDVSKAVRQVLLSGELETLLQTDKSYG